MSLFFSNEPIQNNKLLKQPLNSLSSLFYLIPMYYTEDYYGKFILLNLTLWSLLWWGTKNEIINSLDIYSVVSVLTWIISKTYNPYVNALVLFIPSFDKKMIKLIIITNSMIILIHNYNIYSKMLYLIACLLKLSDTYYGNKYGTCLFHVLSALSIHFNCLSQAILA